MVAQKKIRLGELLIANGLIDEEQLNIALRKQRQTRTRLGRTLVDLQFVSEDDLLKVLSDRLSIPYTNLKTFPTDKALMSRLPETLARRYRMTLLKEMSDSYLVGMVDPLDIFAIDELQRVLRKKIKPSVVREKDLMFLLDATYRRASEISNIAEELEDELQETDLDLDSFTDQFSDDDAPVVRLLRNIFEDAVGVNASDIHIEPDEACLYIRMRVDGVLQEQVINEKRIATALVSKLKIMSSLDISEKRMPQDGRFRIRIKDKILDVRLSTMPCQFGESVVMRLLDSNLGYLQLDQLGLDEEMVGKFRKLMRQPNGMVIVTGPTGSGKTTTMYSALNELNASDVKIITVEDPIEYSLPRITQVQTNSKIQLDFAKVLRSALRQDPDILMIGEMRDYETAEIGLRAALTGHMVLTTLHTNDAISSVIRLMDMGAEPYLLASALRVVLSQRLVRKICPHCKVVHEPTMLEKVWLVSLTGEDESAAQTYYQGEGCQYCHNTGYIGRQAVYEMLVINEDMIQALRQGDAAAFSDAVKSSNQYRELALNAYDLAAQGETSLEEVFKVSSAWVVD